MTEFDITAEERSGMYQLLAACYLQTPNEENTKLILELIEGARDIFSEIDFSNLLEESKTRYELIKENPEAIEVLKQEYFDHTIIPVSPNFIPPYESSIKGATPAKDKGGKRNKSGWNYNKASGASAYNTELAYKTVGFNPDKLNHSNDLKTSKKPDHIGYELAFMAYLNSQQIHEEEDINWYKLQSQFLSEHLLDFSIKYSEISSEKANGFYKALSDVLISFIRWDNDTRKIQEVK